MATTDFSAGTVITSTWLNDVDNAVYAGINNGWPCVTDEAFGAVGDGVTNDTAAFTAFFASLSTNSVGVIPPGTYLLDPVAANMSQRTILAYGAKFILNSTGYLFDFNPDADSSNPTGTSKQYGYWFGGHFTSNETSPVDKFCAIKAYGFRQLVVAYCIFGDSGVTRLTHGIEFTGLGGHLFLKNRFRNVGVGFYTPDWDATSTNSAIPVTTCKFDVNEFILSAGQKGWLCEGGFQRWKILGGFANCPENSIVFHGTNNHESASISFDGVGFEQSDTNSKFVYLEDVSATKPTAAQISQVSFRDLQLAGDPAGGGHVSVDLENCTKVLFSNVRTSAQIATGNISVRADENCGYITFDNACRTVDPSLTTGAVLDFNAAIDRQHLQFPSVYFSSPLNIAGYAGDSFSTTEFTLDLPTLITGERYQKHGVAPLGYTLRITARDSASAAATSCRIQVGRNAADITADANTHKMYLNGVTNDQRRTETFYQPCDTDGTIRVKFNATGTDTMDVWLYVVAIHN